MSSRQDLRGLEALADLVENLRYKPGWKLAVDPYAGFVMDRYQGLGLLRISYPAPDAYNPLKMRDQKFTCNITNEIEAAQAVREEWEIWLYSVIAFVELHEVAEFYQPYGVRIYDPHDSERARTAPCGVRVMPFVPDNFRSKEERDARRYVATYPDPLHG